MGCTTSHSPAARTNRVIDNVLNAAAEEYEQSVRLLLLGTGQSGKSTILKQLQILHQDGFTHEERVIYRNLIRQNTINSVHTLVLACEALGVPLTADDQRHARFVKEVGAMSNSAQESWDAVSGAARIRRAQVGLHLDDGEDGGAGGDGEAAGGAAGGAAEAGGGCDGRFSLLEQIRASVAALWKSAAVQRAYGNRNQFQLLENAPFFFSIMDRSFDMNYEPTDKDILHSRRATSGVLETSFWIEQTRFHVFDVGGQRGERKKWIAAFDNVTAILWVASLSEFDVTLAEDSTVNRMAESLQLFEAILTLPWFVDTPVLLFLNKTDLLRSKLDEGANISLFWPDYQGDPRDFDLVEAFILDTYKKRVPGREIFSHFTCATDTEGIQFVWSSARHIILQRHLDELGLMT